MICHKRWDTARDYGDKTRRTNEAIEGKRTLLFSSFFFARPPLCRLFLICVPQTSPPPPGRGMSGWGIGLRKRPAGIYDKPGVRNRPATALCLTPVRPGPISHRHDKMSTSRMESDEIGKANAPFLSAQFRRILHATRRPRLRQTDETRQQRTPDDMGQTTQHRPAPRDDRRDGKTRRRKPERE